MSKCAIRGCPLQIPMRDLMCVRHWEMVPRDVARRLTEAWNLYRFDHTSKARAEYSRARREAIYAVTHPVKR